MDTERNLLFGVVAFQNGAVDADGLAETCAAWASEPTRPLADLMVDRGLMTDEQRTEVEKAVAQELATHGGDPAGDAGGDHRRPVAGGHRRGRRCGWHAVAAQLGRRRRCRAAMSCWGRCRRARRRAASATR